MPFPSEKSGENLRAQLGTTLYKLQGTFSANLQVRTANARGSGDSTGRPKPIGLTDDSSYDFTAISGDTGLLTLNGTTVMFAGMDGDTTQHGPVEAMLLLTLDAEIGGMQTFKCKAVPLAMPPEVAHLDYS